MFQTKDKTKPQKKNFKRWRQAIYPIKNSVHFSHSVVSKTL